MWRGNASQAVDMHTKRGDLQGVEGFLDFSRPPGHLNVLHVPGDLLTPPPPTRVTLFRRTRWVGRLGRRETGRDVGK